MEIPEPTKLQYSTVNNNNLNYGTVDLHTILSNLSDVIPNDGFTPFYAKKLRELGQQRFIELANKARSGSDTPQRLFCWMLTHPEEVK